MSSHIFASQNLGYTISLLHDKLSSFIFASKERFVVALHEYAGMGKQIGLSIVAILILLAVAIYYVFLKSASGNLPHRLAELVEIPKEDKDDHGNSVQHGADVESGWPLEVREKKTGMPMIFIPPGTFTMGSNDGTDDEKPAHAVTLSQPFYAGKYELTVGQFKIFTKETSYKTRAEVRGGGEVFISKNWERKEDATWLKPYIKQDDSHPVVMVSYYDAEQFMDWLNGEHGRRFRLPTEAQWEYMARGKTTSKWYWGDNPDQITAFGNVGDRSAKIMFNLTRTIEGDDGFAATSPVGRFKPNSFGLYDTAGNVWEWCDEWYDRKFYRSSPKADPVSPRDPDKQMNNRILRGGAWLNEPDTTRSSNRNWFRPGFRNNSVGFRVLLAEPN